MDGDGSFVLEGVGKYIATRRVMFPWPYVPEPPKAKNDRRPYFNSTELTDTTPTKSSCPNVYFTLSSEPRRSSNVICVRRV